MREDGFCWTLAGSNPKMWPESWTHLGGFGTLAQQTPITILETNELGLDLYAVGQDGNVYSLWNRPGVGRDADDWVPIIR